MGSWKSMRFAALTTAIICLGATAHADTVFVDPFSAPNSYSSAVLSAPYTVTDENADTQSVWTAGGGTLTYSRANTSRDPEYHYQSSVLLTSGSGSLTGNTAGLNSFTVTGSIYNVPSVNTAQPGLIVSGKLGSGAGTGGYLLESDNGQNQGPGSPFVLLAVSGAGLIGDEGGGTVVQNFGIPTTGHNYSVSVTVDRSAANPAFTVLISDLTSLSIFYSGSFSDLTNTSDFGGTQIGYRVRNPLDSGTPTFGPLSLFVPTPEPSSLAFAGITLFALRRNRARRSFASDR